MKKICTHLILILIAFCNIAVLTGCVHFDTRSYFSSADNRKTLRALGDNKINVGDFTSYKPRLKGSCLRGLGL